MQIARIELPYDVHDKLTAAQCDELRAAFFVHPIFEQQPVKFKAKDDGLFEVEYWSRNFIADLDLIDTVPVTVKCRLRLTDALKKMADQTPLAFNEKVQVVVPSANLLEITEVAVREDYCTDSLRQELKLGWRILAICPQPDQRRPDYILGRRGS